jgi:hypothetical protein
LVDRRRPGRLITTNPAGARAARTEVCSGRTRQLENRPVTRPATAAFAIVLAVLLVVGGAAALATQDSRPGPPAVPAEGAGSGEVQMSPDAEIHPAGEAVRAQLQRHYDGINRRNYEQWRETVVPARSDALGEEAWLDAYATTQDGTIRVERIDAAPDGALLVRVRFISTQAVEDAPPDLPADRICWRSTLPMRGTPPLIDVTGGGSSARERC